MNSPNYVRPDILHTIVGYLERLLETYNTPNKGAITSYGRGARDQIRETLDYIQIVEKQANEPVDNDF